MSTCICHYTRKCSHIYHLQTKKTYLNIITQKHRNFLSTSKVPCEKFLVKNVPEKVKSILAEDVILVLVTYLIKLVYTQFTYITTTLAHTVKQTDIHRTRRFIVNLARRRYTHLIYARFLHA